MKNQKKIEEQKRAKVTTDEELQKRLQNIEKLKEERSNQARLAMSDNALKTKLRVEKYKKSQPNKGFKGKTALNIAVEKNNLEIVKLLLKNERIDVNAPYKPNEREVESALYLAVEKENIEIIKLLLTNDQLDINFLNISNMIIYKIKFISLIQFKII